MNARTTVVLVLLVLLGLAYLLVGKDLFRIGTTESRRERSRKVLDVDAESVTKIRLVREGIDAVLERGDGESWVLVEPVKAEANAAVVRRLVHGLEDHLVAQGSDPGGTALDRFGLDPPGIRLEIWTAAERMELLVGGVTPTGGRRYVMRGGSDEVFTVDGAIHEELDRTLLELRDRRVFRIPPYRVDRVDIRGPKEAITATRTEDGWEIVEPLRDLADGPKIEELLYRWTGIEIEEFRDDAPSDAGVTGLDDPTHVVTVAAQEGESSETIRLGAPLPDRSDVLHADRGPDTAPFVVSAGVVPTFELAPADLRSKRIITLPKADWKWLEIGEGDSAILVERSGNAFRIIRPREHPADGDTVRAAVAALERARVRRFVADRLVDVDRPRFALDPGLRVRIAAEGGESSTILLGGLDEDGRFAFAARPDGGPVLAMDGDVFELVPRDVLALRSRDVAEIDLFDASVVTLVRPDRTYVARLGDDFHFRIEAPLEGRMDADVTGRLEARLRPLRATRLVAESPGDLAEYGLDEPSIRLAVELEAQDASKAGRTVSVLFGRIDAGGHTFAVVAGNDLVFTVAPDLVDLLRGEWLDRTILEARAADVSRVRLTRNGERSHLLRKDASWEILEPEDGSFDGDLLASMLDTLVGPIAKRFLVENPGPETTGLDAPTITVSLDLEGEAAVETVTLLIGQEAEGGVRFASVEGSGRVFLLSDAIVARLRVTP